MSLLPFSLLHCPGAPTDVSLPGWLPVPCALVFIVQVRRQMFRCRVAASPERSRFYCPGAPTDVSLPGWLPVRSALVVIVPVCPQMFRCRGGCQSRALSFVLSRCAHRCFAAGVAASPELSRFYCPSAPTDVSLPGWLPVPSALVFIVPVRPQMFRCRGGCQSRAHSFLRHPDTSQKSSNQRASK